jgi:hypothetical protein
MDRIIASGLLRAVLVFSLISPWCLFAASMSAARASAGEGATIGAINPQQLAKVVPGISKARVHSLLGAPWRTVQYSDMDNLEDEIWEYRGKDSSGTFRLHIEFDHHDVVRIVSKIPEHSAGGKGAGENVTPPS